MTLERAVQKIVITSVVSHDILTRTWLYFKCLGLHSHRTTILLLSSSQFLEFSLEVYSEGKLVNYKYTRQRANLAHSQGLEAPSSA